MAGQAPVEEARQTVGSSLGPERVGLQEQSHARECGVTAGAFVGTIYDPSDVG